ncbi:MAG: GGDEF domain-containing protein [Pseudomonadales bacterium]|nr:GGDEF domain-containing protein [Pseudomonadales bacterium]MBO6564786.1 GGDEF domain-containing protein [Pseudomonadales bacterium]MBO6597025.1 GGDEF domain-containing protein [Pseudomonadales bacterium]MBO6823789.1 GGDEF domain-containing protein [Pseudomonadales bacterium]
MEHQLIQSIIEITRARDTDTLETSLLSTLADILPISHIAMINLLDELKLEKCEQTLSLKVSYSDQNEKVRVWDSDIRPLELSPEIATQIHDRKMAAISSGDETKVYVPLFDDADPAYLLELRSIGHDLREHANLIEGIAGIYSNFLKVLEDSQRDKLTGLLNRRTFDKKLVRMMELQRKVVEDYGDSDADRRTPAKSEYAWLAIIDIDHFKKVNDVHGHIYGDEVILTIGQRMKQFFRNTDLLFRFGGEEFLVVLEPMPRDRARMALDRFRDSVEAHVFQQIGGITVSIGFARLEEQDYPPEVIDRADKALYFAKEHGRNQVANYEHLLDEGLIQARSVASGEIDLF